MIFKTDERLKMFNLKISLFSQTKELENKIDLLHDKIIDMAMNFRQAMNVFVTAKRNSEYKKLNKIIKNIEHEADVLRREIESKLYEQNLIPDFRADVLEMVENIDSVLNKFDEVAYKLYIERPEIPEIYRDLFIELVHQVTECTENMAIASRAFFRDFATVRDYSKKVYILEHESDNSSAKIRQQIFDSDIELAKKLQLNAIITEVADIADIAEDYIDELLIFTIKRDV